LFVVALALAGAAAAEAPAPRLLSFYPQAGVLGQDLYLTNYLDLQEGPGVRDWACGSHSYDGHTGLDSIVRSFREVKIGVPVFAALEGRVASIQHAVGGDFNWGRTVSRFDNHVVLDHGGGQESVYGHLARASIKVKKGQWVAAGTQIARTASSGNSSWPHLHFTVRQDFYPYEPFAGPCRAGASGFASQPVTRRDAYVGELALSAKPFTGRADLPYDEAVRTGTFVRGARAVNVRVELRNLDAAGSGRLVVRRPDGSIANEGAMQIAGYRAGWAKRRLPLDLTPGRWLVAYALDGNVIAEAPFDVVMSAQDVRNRPPNAVVASLDPAAPRAGEVVVCKVASSLVTEDPDYQIVRYLYRWTAGTRVVRRVTSAALSDAIPNNVVRAGETLTCEVTPSDGKLHGPVASVAAQSG